MSERWTNGERKVKALWTYGERTVSALWTERSRKRKTVNGERTVSTLWTHGEQTEKWESRTFEGLYVYIP